MKPNPSRKYWTNLLLLLGVLRVGVGLLLARLDLRGGRARSAAARATSCSEETPSRAATKIVSYCPRLPSSACAVGTSKTAIVAPPIEFTVP